MAAHASDLGALLYADEASFAEISTTFDERLPVTNEINDIVGGLSQDRMDPRHTLQYQNDGRINVKLLQGGSFTLSGWITGHGSTGAGSIAATVLPTYLGRVIGNSDAAQVGGTVNTPTSATQFTTTGVTTVAGGVIRVGALGDGDGEAQAYRVNNPATLTVLNALAGTPLNGAVIYATEMVYPTESPTTAGAVTSLRMQAQTANQKYNIFGVCPTGLSIDGLNTGEVPRWSVTHTCAAWAPENSSTFPTATATDYFSPTPIAAGTLFVNDVGTTTRSVIDYRDLSISFDFQTVPLFGPGAPRTYQGQVGCRRIKNRMRLQFTVDSEAAGTDTWGDLWNAADGSQVYRHIMYTGSTADGQSFGFYCPRVKLVGQRPTQSSRGGLNAKTVMFEAVTGATTTSELTMANYVLWFG